MSIKRRVEQLERRAGEAADLITEINLVIHYPGGTIGRSRLILATGETIHVEGPPLMPAAEDGRP